MKKMYNTVEPKKDSNKITIKANDLKIRNELHFQVCLNNNCYIAKNKKKIIPRKQKYKTFYWQTKAKVL